MKLDWLICDPLIFFSLLHTDIDLIILEGLSWVCAHWDAKRQKERRRFYSFKFKFYTQDELFFNSFSKIEVSCTSLSYNMKICEYIQIDRASLPLLVIKYLEGSCVPSKVSSIVNHPVFLVFLLIQNFIIVN